MENEKHIELNLESIHSATPSCVVSVDIDCNTIELSASAKQTQDKNNNRALTTIETSDVEINHDIIYESGNIKWRKLFLNPMFFGRLLTLMLCLLLLTLSIGYCIAQQSFVTLELVTKCVPKTKEAIYYHSYLSSLIDGSVVMNAESHHGLTAESCWTTNAIDINTDELWYSNKYKAQWNDTLHYKFVLFAFISLYCFVIIFYALKTTICDIYYVKNNMIHLKSVKYRKFNNESGSTKSDVQRNIFSKICFIYCSLYHKYMATDTTGWIIRNVMKEVMELTLQSQALLLYNGYHILDKDNVNDVYLANKPHYILLFAMILAINAFGSALLWLFYSLAHKQCYGFTFKLTIFIVDKFSDLFYTIFPFIMVFTDTYNQKHNQLSILLGQLNVNSGLAFASAFVPLLLLCNKSLFIISSATYRLRNNYYYEWKFINTVLNAADNKEIVASAYKGNKVNIENVSSRDKELYNDEGRLATTFIKTANRKGWIDRNVKSNMEIRIKQSILIIISLLYIVFGIIMLFSVLNHIENAETYCNSIKESNYFDINGTFISIDLSSQQRMALELNPELFFWDKCLYKTYPFNNNQCECRVLVIDWNNLHSTANQRMEHFNLTQNKVFMN